MFLVFSGAGEYDDFDDAEKFATALAEREGSSFLVEVPDDWRMNAMAYRSMGVVAYAADSPQGRSTFVNSLLEEEE